MFSASAGASAAGAVSAAGLVVSWANAVPVRATTERIESVFKSLGMGSPYYSVFVKRLYHVCRPVSGQKVVTITVARRKIAWFGAGQLKKGPKPIPFSFFLPVGLADLVINVTLGRILEEVNRQKTSFFGKKSRARRHGQV